MESIHRSIGILNAEIFDAKRKSFMGVSTHFHLIKLSFYKYGILAKFNYMSPFPSITNCPVSSGVLSGRVCLLGTETYIEYAAIYFRVS
jgi:hypothetical protein